MYPEILESYVEKIYAWSRGRTFSFYEVVMQMGRKEGIMADLNFEWICDVLTERA